MACLLSKISFIRKIHRFFFRLYLEKKRKLNIVKTLWFNISFLPWKQAKHFPFFIHGSLTVAREGGALLLDIPDSELKPGLIRLGYDYDRFSTNYAGTLLQLSGTIRWKGPFRSSVNLAVMLVSAPRVPSELTALSSLKTTSPLPMTAAFTTRISILSAIYGQEILIHTPFP